MADKNLQEMARAAVIAAHAAASYAAAAGRRDIARLLRSAEGTSRCAVAMLARPPPPEAPCAAPEAQLAQATAPMVP